MPIPVTVVTGFLGAGKSTILERWLEDLPRDETLVIVNEAGEVGIDGALLAQKVARIVEITGGCLCCTTQAALDTALTECVAATPRPTRILVETSGAASPSGVLRVLTKGAAREGLRLDGVVSVLDAARARSVLAHELAVEQLGFADAVVLSHVDLCNEEDVVALEEALTAYAPAAVVVRSRRSLVSPCDVVPLLALLEARMNVLHEKPPTHHAHAHHGIESVSLVHDGELDEEAFGAWVEGNLGGIEARIARVKGILAVRGVPERVIVQGVGDAVEVTLGVPWGTERRTSRLVVLGLGLDEAHLRLGFAACAADRATR